MTTHVVTDEMLGVLARRQNDLFRRVREGTLPPEAVLRGLQDIIEGNFGMPTGLRRVIDCDAQPYIPDGWEIEEHIRRGELEFDPARVAFHLDEGQRKGRTVVGNELRKRLAGFRVMNACVLDHLLTNTNLVPEAWKTNEDGSTRYTFFWGTIYRAGDCSLCVRSLYWIDGRWDWDYDWLDDRWDAERPAAILAS